MMRTQSSTAYAYVGGGSLSDPVLNEGAHADVKTLPDLALSTLVLGDYPVVNAWHDKLLSSAAIPEICVELPRLMTDFLRLPSTQDLSYYMRRAESLHYVFSHKTPLVKASDLLPGQTTTSFVGPLIYMDADGIKLASELSRNHAYKINPSVKKHFEDDIFPFWTAPTSVNGFAHYSYYDSQEYGQRDGIEGQEAIDPVLNKVGQEAPRCQKIMASSVFFNIAKAGGATHAIPDFERVLTHGLDALMVQMQADVDQGIAQTAQQQEFVAGVCTVFSGVKTYARRLADAADRVGNAELARICRKVPAKPAATLHEALVSLWICYHLLLQENSNSGFSLGRLDQLLQPYYMSDWLALSDEKDKTNYSEHAVELICHLLLRCTDHVPLITQDMERQAPGVGANQCITLGGTRHRQGRVTDAVNDMTYIILKAAELLKLRDPDIHVRYNKAIHQAGARTDDDALDPYLRRLSQIKTTTGFLPVIHRDDSVVNANVHYYNAHCGITDAEAKRDAYDYAVVAGIEHNAPGQHFSAAGALVLSLPAVLELALFGGKHRCYGIDKQAPNVVFASKDYTSKPLPQIESMAEFMAAFRFQLDEMTKQLVQCNNYYGRAAEVIRPAPFLSGLFNGPSNRPGGQGASFSDIAAGGAKYNSVAVSVVGLADVIDAMSVLDQLVFKGDVSATELLAAMDCDFGRRVIYKRDNNTLISVLFKGLQERFDHGTKLEDLPQLSTDRLAEIKDAIRLAAKFGAGLADDKEIQCDNGVAVHYSQQITRLVRDVFYQYRSHRGGRYRPNYSSATNHIGLGALTQALPHGRQSGEPFSTAMMPGDNIVNRKGKPTRTMDHVHFLSEIDSNTLSNGCVYNLSFVVSGGVNNTLDLAYLPVYMQSFIEQTDLAVQINVLRLDELKAAHCLANDMAYSERQKRHDHPGLVVRLGAYPVQFVLLPAKERLALIRRIEAALSLGIEQHALLPM